MTLTDEELDREWQPSGKRPQSTIARSFSAELMDIFRIENSVADLDQQVGERKQKVNQNNEELASLEARLKEMETRLYRGGRSNTRLPIPQTHRNPVTEKSSSSEADQQRSSNKPAVDREESKTARSRPGTARNTQPAPGSGNMPPTPGGSEDDDTEQ